MYAATSLTLDLVAVRPVAAGGASAASEGKPADEEEERGGSGSPLGPGGPHTCSQCRGAYPTREQLERHETLHSPNTQVDTDKYVSDVLYATLCGQAHRHEHPLPSSSKILTIPRLPADMQDLPQELRQRVQTPASHDQS